MVFKTTEGKVILKRFFFTKRPLKLLLKEQKLSLVTNKLRTIIPLFIKWYRIKNFSNWKDYYLKLNTILINFLIKYNCVIILKIYLNIMIALTHIFEIK